MYYKQPRYFKDFQCIGSACPDNCCYGWIIYWKKSEIDKVLAAENISPELKALAEESFVREDEDENKYKIKLRGDGQCPFQNEDKLCMIQKELGAEYLSFTCMDYPRSATFASHLSYRFCRMTCPVIMDKLLNDKSCMELVSADEKNEKFSVSNNPDDIQKNAVLKYRAELFDFFYDLLSDKKNDADTAIIMGALAAGVLSKAQGREEYDTIPEVLSSLRKQIHNGAMLKSIDAIKPNPQLKFAFLPQITEQITGRTTTVLLHNSDGSLNEELYNYGMRRLNEMLQGREYFWRNVALSLMFELNVPLKAPERTIFENYSLFAVTYACIKLNLVGAMATEKSIMMHTNNQQFCFDKDGKITGLTSLISRGLCQNYQNCDIIIDLLKKNGYDRSAYIALMIK